MKDIKKYKQELAQIEFKMNSISLNVDKYLVDLETIPPAYIESLRAGIEQELSEAMQALTSLELILQESKRNNKWNYLLSHEKSKKKIFLKNSNQLYEIKNSITKLKKLIDLIQKNAGNLTYPDVHTLIAELLDQNLTSQGNLKKMNEIIKSYTVRLQEAPTPIFRKNDPRSSIEMPSGPYKKDIYVNPVQHILFSSTVLLAIAVALIQKHLNIKKRADDI